MIENLVFDLARVLVRSRLAHGIDQEAAGAVEVDCLRASLDDVDLSNVVGGWLGSQRAEERRGHVNSVEQVDVRLTATAGARTANRVLSHHGAWNELLDIRVVLPDRESADLRAAQCVLDRSRIAIDERVFGRHRDALSDAAHGHFHVGGHVLTEKGIGLPRRSLHSGERELQRVRPRLKLGQTVVAVAVRHGDPWLRQRA